MSLTRKLLKGMELSEEQIDSIISEHSNTVSALKEEIDDYKEKADKASEIEKEYNKLKKIVDSDDTKEKLDKVTAEFKAYKKEAEAKELASTKEALRNKLIEDAGIPSNWTERVKKSISLNDLEVEDGKLKDESKMLESIKAEWSDVIGKVSEQGANIAKPPINTGGKVTMTREEIRKIQNPIERQKAMLENASLFGLGKGD